MCGISGIIGKKVSFDTRLAIELMVKKLKHRGPDNIGISKLPNSNGFFGHNRLSIIDLSSSGHQPMEYKGLTITYNGEIYNYKEIKMVLEGHGYRFEGNSDTEVIIKSFHLWGVSCVDRFIGMFAFGVYDSLNRKIYLIRDRVGVKPLYFSQSAVGFTFASELKAILEESQWRVNHEAVSDYLHRGYLNRHDTFYENIREVAPGTILTYEIKDDKLSSEKYWSSEKRFVPQITEEEGSYGKVKTSLRKLLGNSFNYRMVSDVKVGVFLSSGYDSTLVAALLSQEHELNTFTIGFEDKAYDESVKSRAIAKHLKTNHTEIICGPDEIVDFISELPTIFDEPFGDTSCLPTLLVNKYASQHVKVVLSADGGDEQFGGYSHYDLSESIFDTHKAVAKIPFLSQMASSGSSLLEKSLKFDFDNLRKLEILKLFRLNREKFIYEYHVEKSQMKFLVRRFLRNERSPKTNYNIAPPFSLDNWQSQIMLNDYNNYMVNILKKVDRASMFHSVESREPFLDHRIFEYSSGLPLRYKIKNDQKKCIIRDLVHELVPRRLMEEKKRGFGIPIIDWFRGHLKDYFLDNFSETLIRQSTILNSEEVLQFRDQFLKSGFGNYYLDQAIWRLFTLGQWEKKYQKYIITSD